MGQSLLSITEVTVLAVIWRSGPCTTYAVMRELAQSPSTFYRNRASSTYRITQRLIDAGLVEPVGSEVGPRGDKTVRVTESGFASLVSWLSPPVPAVEIAHTIDLVQLRVTFLRAIPHEERIRFVHESIAELHRVASAAEERVANGPDPFSQLASLGTLHETRARIAWLQEVLERLPSLPQPEALDSSAF